MNFPVRPVFDELDTISGLGFDYLELSMDPPNGHHSKVREQKAALRKALDERNMGLVCHLPSFVSTAPPTSL